MKYARITLTFVSVAFGGPKAPDQYVTALVKYPDRRHKVERVCLLIGSKLLYEFGSFDKKLSFYEIHDLCTVEYITDDEAFLDMI